MKSRGLGDDIAKVLKKVKIDTLVEKTMEVIGVKDCGCEKRKEKLNKLFAYKHE